MAIQVFSQQRQFESVTLLLTTPSTNISLGAILAYNAFPYNFTISSIRADVAVAPTGSSLIVDMLKNNVSMMSTKFIINANSFTSSSPVLSTNSISLGDKLSFNVDQIGATVAGQYLTINLNGWRT